MSKAWILAVIGAAAELEHAEVPLVARAEGVPRQLDDPVRHRELGYRRDVLVPVFSDEEDGRVVRREEPGDLVQHQPHLLGSTSPGRGSL